MSTELLQAIAASNEWWALGPEIILACAALALLVIELVTPREQHRFIPHVACMALAVSSAGCWYSMMYMGRVTPLP